jgi:hypothetical protein
MENHLKVASVMANLLDNRFNFMGIRFGIDGLIGLVPGAGDILVTCLSLYLVWIGLKMKLPTIRIMQMIGNVVVNFLIGLLPVVGDATNFFFRANIRNLKILQQYAKNNVIEGEVLQSKHQVSFQ